MKKLFFIVSVAFLTNVLGFSASGNTNILLSMAPVIAAVASADGPILHEEIHNGTRFLVDTEGTLLHHMGQPVVWLDFEDMTFQISENCFYSPGTSYYGNPYTGFTVQCGCHPRASPCNDINLEFGPEAGTFEAPGDGSVGNFQIYCTFKSYVVDGIGKRFESDPLKIFYIKPWAKATGQTNK